LSNIREILDQLETDPNYCGDPSQPYSFRIAKPKTNYFLEGRLNVYLSRFRNNSQGLLTGVELKLVKEESSSVAELMAKYDTVEKLKGIEDGDRLKLSNKNKVALFDRWQFDKEAPKTEAELFEKVDLTDEQAAGLFDQVNLDQTEKARLFRMLPVTDAQKAELFNEVNLGEKQKLGLVNSVLEWEKCTEEAKNNGNI